MPEFTIDGKTHEFNKGDMLLQYCLDNGVEIPYFCYHPAMSVPTNCRMCLVEVGFYARNRETGEIEKDENGEPKINWGRKPNTACNTPVAEGMIVRTHRTSETVKRDQEGVLEYMLANHPLDCPICDQAGECPLQIWTYKYGPEGSRFETSKVSKPKRIELGPNVTLDAERCINCTRCTRFTEEVSGSWQLTITNRGDKNHPTCAPGHVFDDPYSMNTIDLCPVGALTSTDFRFNARVWEMAYTPGVCTGCSKGCNVDVWVRDNKVMRLTPRDNMDVNQFWMCDEGRLDLGRYNDNRITGAKFKGDLPTDIETAVIRAGNMISGFENKSNIVVLGSPFASLEDNYALKQFASKIGASGVKYVPLVEEGWGDELLRKDDRTPNTPGCELLGFSATSANDLASSIDWNSPVLIVGYLDAHVMRGISGNFNEELTNVIAMSTHYADGHDRTDVVFPLATSIEAESTYINSENMPQVTRMAKEIKRMTPEMWMRLPKSRTDKAAVPVDNWRDLENVYDVLPGWSLLTLVGNQMGFSMGYGTHADIFGKMKGELEILADVTVSYKVPKEAFKYTQYDFAVK